MNMYTLLTETYNYLPYFLIHSWIANIWDLLSFDVLSYFFVLLLRPSVFLEFANRSLNIYISILKRRNVGISLVVSLCDILISFWITQSNQYNNIMAETYFRPLDALALVNHHACNTSNIWKVSRHLIWLEYFNWRCAPGNTGRACYFSCVSEWCCFNEWWKQTST